MLASLLLWNRGKFGRKRTPFPKSDLIKKWVLLRRNLRCELCSVSYYSFHIHSLVTREYWKLAFLFCHFAQFFEELKRISLTVTYQADHQKHDCILGDIEQKHPYRCNLFFTLSLKCLSIQFLTLELVSKYRVLRHFFAGPPTEPVYCRFGIEAGRSEA